MTATAIPDRDAVLALPDGRSLAWCEWGDPAGTPVLLIEGMPGSRRFCPDLETTLERGIRLVAMDRPGYGGSSPTPGRRVGDWAADAEALLDALAIESAPFVGWSTGSSFALGAAHHLGPRLTALALVAGDAPLDEHAEGLAALPEVVRDLMARVRADPTGPAMAAVEARCAWYAADPVGILGVRAAAAAAKDPDGILRGRIDVYDALWTMFMTGGQQGSAGLIGDWLAISQPWGFRLADISTPTTVWFGDGDRIGSRSDSEFLAAGIPGARLRIVPDEGHLLPIRQWGAILDELLSSAGS